ncbi:MAG: dynamin family protein [bacterium]
MSTLQFRRDLDRFGRWKKRQTQLLDLIEPWFKQQGLYTSEAQKAIRLARKIIANDSLTIAVVGEYSRGKTELINALFFSDLGNRLLPTDAGRTTMCPTEIFQSKEAPFLQLLPIETRLHDASLGELRDKPEYWTHVPLDITKPATLQSDLQRIKEHIQVTKRDADKLGLGELGAHTAGDDDQVEIPRWRMALLNIRHPLLAKGLRILDTPGLNAIGNEPELTYEILPNAQATLFVLGIDTGVTQSDLQMWQQHLHSPATSHHRGTIAVLNKTDTLWDGLRSESEIQSSIAAQSHEVAKILDISSKQVFALSAQQALVARVQEKPELEDLSGIQSLEEYLGNQMLHSRQDLLMDRSINLVRNAIDSLYALVHSRLKRMQAQAEELSSLSNDSGAALANLVKNTADQKKLYQTSIKAYREAKSEFEHSGQLLMEALSASQLEQLISQSEKRMKGAWTTFGLKNAMGELFEEINQRMEIASAHAQAMRRLIRTIYRRFESQHDFVLGDPRMFSIITHQVELGLVHQESVIFQNSPRTTLTEQHFAVRRYFQTIVRRVREVFSVACNDASDWLDTAIDPLTRQIQEHRSMLEDQLSNLQQAGESRYTVDQRITAISRDQEILKGQLRSLKKIHKKLGSMTPDSSEPQQPGQSIRKTG